MGNSFGGAVAMRMLADEPSRFTTLTLVNSAGFGKEVTLALRILAIPGLGLRLLRRVDQRVARRIERSLFVDRALATEERVAFALRINARPEHAHVFLEAARELGTVRGIRARWRSDLLAEVARHRIPTLVVWGERDLFLPSAHLAAARSACPTRSRTYSATRATCRRSSGPTSSRRWYARSWRPIGRDGLTSRRWWASGVAGNQIPHSFRPPIRDGHTHRRGRPAASRSRRRGDPRSPGRPARWCDRRLRPAVPPGRRCEPARRRVAVMRLRHPARSSRTGSRTTPGRRAEPCPHDTLRSCPPGVRTEADPGAGGRLFPGECLDLHQNDLTLRPITGRDELDLFCRLPYVLNEELAGDLAAGRRRRNGCGSPCAATAWWPGPHGGRGRATTSRCCWTSSTSTTAPDRARTACGCSWPPRWPTWSRPARPAGVRPLRPAGLARRRGRRDRRGRRPDGRARTDRRPAVRRTAAAGMAARHARSPAGRAADVPAGRATRDELDRADDRGAGRHPGRAQPRGPDPDAAREAGRAGSTTSELVALSPARTSGGGSRRCRTASRWAS